MCAPIGIYTKPSRRTGFACDAANAVIDGAIGESREALDKEPESTVAQDSLVEALRNKVTLLQDTVALINTLRHADADGTADQATGLNQ